MTGKPLFLTAAVLAVGVCSGGEGAQAPAATPTVSTVTNGVMLEARPTITRNAAGEPAGAARTDIRFGFNRVKEFRTFNLQLGNGINVPIQLPVVSTVEVATTATVPLVRASLGGNVHSGWIPIAGLERAVNLAETNGRPILFLEKSSKAEIKDRNMANSYAAFPGFKGFVRVEKSPHDAIESPDVREGFEKAATLHSDERTPRLTCVDTKGRVLGVIPYGAGKRQLAEKAEEFADLFGTLRVMDKNVSTGDRLVEMGRYNTAMKVYSHVSKCDDSGKYYPRILEKKRGEIESAAKARIDEAEKLLAEGNRTGAAQLVNPVILDGGDFHFTRRAREVKQNCLKL